MQAQSDISIRAGYGGKDAGNASADITFYTASGSVQYTSTERMRIRGNGNIGIGTSAAAAKLHIVGTANAAGGIRLNNGTNNADIYQDSGHNFIIDPHNDFIVTGADDIKLQCGDDIEFIGAGGMAFVSGSTNILNLRYDGGGITNYRGTVGKT